MSKNKNEVLGLLKVFFLFFFYPQNEIIFKVFVILLNSIVNYITVDNSNVNCINVLNRNSNA